MGAQGDREIRVTGCLHSLFVAVVCSCLFVALSDCRKRRADVGCTTYTATVVSGGTQTASGRI